MNAWQEKFPKKLETVRAASKDRFERLAREVVLPVFEELSGFVTGHGLQATTPLNKGGIRTFKFSIIENAYLLLTFRLAGLVHCETHAEFSIPHHTKLAPITERVELSLLDTTWTRQKFEHALDGFIEMFVESISAEGDAKLELIAAH